MKAFIIGAGTMGTGIAQAFAAAGYVTTICDVSQELAVSGVKRIEKGLIKLVEKGKMGDGERLEIMDRLSATACFDNIKDCDIAVEAAAEVIGVKKEIFKKLEAACSPDTILATNTSSLSITEIAAAVNIPQRVIGMHFFNPVPIMKLVEVINGMETSPEVTRKVIAIAKCLGKEPIEVAEGPGFVVNRLLVPMINEACEILSEGIASAEDIDKAMMLGANHPMGPLALSDLIGNDITLAIMETLYKETGDSKYHPSTLLKKYVRAGKLGKKTKKGFFKYN